MREMELSRMEVGETERFTCRYFLLIRTLPLPVAGESYGLGIEVMESGESVKLPDITVNSARITELAERVIRGQVTPCTLRDVVEDWL